MTAVGFDVADVPVIDADAHIIEPPDLWTSRLSSRWGDAIPHVEYDERHAMDRWVVGGKRLTGVANYALAGWPEYPPSYPRTLDEVADRGAFSLPERLERMDEYGLAAQALYPNLLAFSNASFLRVGEDFGLACVEAYNDFLTDFVADAPDRFILLTALPIWDVNACVQETIRCHERGHHGVLFIAKPHKANLPALRDPYWEPLFKTVDELGVSMNFHVGFADFTEEDFKSQLSAKAERRDYAKLSSLQMLANAEAIVEILVSGLCHQYPNINFVSVESGFGWLPSFLECVDWQWMSSGSAKAYPEMELPSFYFRRQVHGMFWFEHQSVRRVMDLYPDNLMYETDYPHPTSMSPGPASAAKNPKTVVREVFDGMPEDLTRKVLYGNAARVYGLALETKS